MDWHCNLPGNDEEEGYLLSNGGPFSFSVASMLWLGSCSLVVCNGLKQDYPVAYVNAAFEKATGYRTEEVLGRNWY